MFITRYYKNVVSALLALIMMLSVMVVPVAASEADTPERPTFDYNFETIYENNYARLSLDRRNNTIQVLNLSTGLYFNTLAMEGQQGNPLIQNVQRSDFTLDVIRDVTMGNTLTMDSFSESVQRRQVEYFPIDGGVRAHFTLGDPDALHLTMFPMFISEERMNELVFSHASDADVSALMQRYVLVDGRYTRWITTYDLATGEPSTVGIPILRTLWRLFYEEGDYTFDELDYDNAYWGYTPFEPPMLVSLSVEYTLDGPDLIVTVPREYMEFLDTQPFRSITLHPYLMSGTTFDDGFLFIPDGSGGIINFNNGMTMEDVNIPVFGRDLLLQGWAFHEFFEQATLPIFGVVRNDMGILAVIEEGAPVATIHANVSGRIDEYNRVFASFDLSFFEGLLMRGAGMGATTVQHMDVYDMDIRIRYILLSGENATAVGMAQAYQRYLLERGLLRTNYIPQDAPFFVEFYATSPRQRMRFGIPSIHHFPMTSTEDAQNILQSLTDQGIRNIHAQYSHWTNGGMMSTSLDRITPLRSIGGRSGVRDLVEFSESIDVNLYPNIRGASFVMMPGRVGRTRQSMLVRNLSNSFQVMGWRAIFDRGFGGGAFMLQPGYWLNYLSRVASNLSNLGFTRVSITDLGGTLFGHYGRRNQVTRLEAMDYAIETFENMSGQMDLMLINPNAYAFAHTSVIADLPFRSGRRRVVDYNIPFVQWVLENHIPHGKPAFNLDPMSMRGFEEYLLRAVESRSGLSLILTQENEEHFSQTYLQYWMLNMIPMLTQYSRWEDRIGDYYARFNEFWHQVHGATTIGHEALNGGNHVIVSYSNGVVVYINYSDNYWVIDGKTIAPLSFEVTR